MKYLRVLILSLFFTLLSFAQIKAVDLTVTCSQEGPCSMSPNSGKELFYEENMLPGESVTRHIHFENQDTRYDCPLYLEAKNPTQTPPDFATKLFTEIRSGSTTLYGGTSTTLDDFYNAGNLFLGDIPSSSTSTFDWSVTFDPLTDNNYQAAETVFDFDLHFSCGAPEPTPTPDNGDDGGDGGGTGGNPSAPTCDDPAPESAPVNFRLITSRTNSVTLAWDPVSPVTHYALYFVRVSDGEEYGASDIGNVTTYTINNLSGGDSYNFEIFAVNGCMPGDRAYLGSIAVTGPFIPGRPIGEGGEVLGEATKSAQLKDLEIPSILGASDNSCSDPKNPWYIPLIIQLITLILLLWTHNEEIKESKHNLIILVLLIFISQLIHIYIWPCTCSTHWLCQYYIWFNLATILPQIIFFKKDE